MKDDRTLDVGVLQDRAGELLLALSHGGIGHALRRLGDRLNDTGILEREEPLRNDDVEQTGQEERGKRNQEDEGLAVQHPVEHAAIYFDDPVERPMAVALKRVLVGLGSRLEQLGAGHRHQRERNDGRYQDGDGQRDGEFAKQPANHVSHEEERDQHRNQRNRERDDGEPYLLRTTKRCLQGGVTLLEITGDVLDHDNGIVDHEPGGDGQGHQRKIVEAEAEQIHGPQCANQGQRNRKARDQCCARAAQEDEDHEHDQYDGECQLEFHILHRRADRDRAVGENLDVDRRRQRGLQLRQQRLDALDHRYDVGAGLPLDIHDDGRRLVHPGAELVVLGGVDDVADVAEPDRRAILVCDDQRLVVAGVPDLIVGIDRIAAHRPVEVSLGRVHVGVAERGAQVVDVEFVGG